MKKICRTGRFLCFGLVFTLSLSAQSVRHLAIEGYLGSRIDDCIQHRVKAQDVDHLIEPFRHKTETRRWQSEFWGKWVQGAIASYQYNQDPELLKLISESVDALLNTQLSNGYIGNYTPEAQLEQWDVWGRKYTILGLVAYYDLTGDRKALTAACRALDHLMTQVGPGKRNIVDTGNYRGMASSSILKPVMFLYNRTKNVAYLDFAKYIVSQWETPEGPQLISKALGDVPISRRFPHPKIWFSRENGQKAYEMMSCYEGLLELYKVTKEPLYVASVEKTVSRIIKEEINLAGSGSAFECWYGGLERQTLPTYHMMETCVTFTWMQLCNRLLQLTRHSFYADQIEQTIYNALLASLKADASQISKYSPLEGWRHEGEEQCGMHINCCNANGPRAFALIPDYACQVEGNNIYINLYAPSTAEIQLADKQKVTLTQKTGYPLTGQVEIAIGLEKAAEFSIALRIPAWSKELKVKVAGAEKDDCMPGKYYVLHRKWQPGETIRLTFDLRARLVEQNQMQAIVRGPLLLARDSRFPDGDVDETSEIQTTEGYVELTPVQAPGFAWAAFTVPMILGADLEGNREPRIVHFCDFASAGNTWDKTQRYRVWLPRTLNVMHSPYHPY